MEKRLNCIQEKVNVTYEDYDIDFYDAPAFASKDAVKILP